MDPNSAMFHQGKLQYLRRCDLYRLEKPYQTTFDTSALNGPGDNLNFVECPVVFQDAQKLRDNFHLDTNGFEFHRWPTCLTEEEFDSDSTITASYYPEITAYVAKARPASTHIHILGHQRRNAAVDSKENPYELTHPIGPARFAHTDFSPAGAEALLKTLLDKSPDLRGRRYEFLNAWRVTRGPNRNWPLALCDYQSLCLPDDLEFVDVIHREYVGELIMLYGNSTHKWFFLDHEDVEDVLLFKHADSQGINIPFSAHAAFENSSLHASRKSVETRMICFY